MALTDIERAELREIIAKGLRGKQVTNKELEPFMMGDLMPADPASFLIQRLAYRELMRQAMRFALNGDWTLFYRLTENIPNDVGDD